MSPRCSCEPIVRRRLLSLVSVIALAGCIAKTPASEANDAGAVLGDAGGRGRGPLCATLLQVVDGAPGCGLGFGLVAIGPVGAPSTHLVVGSGLYLEVPPDCSPVDGTSEGPPPVFGSCGLTVLAVGGASSFALSGEGLGPDGERLPLTEPVGVGDVDADGFLDLAVRSPGTGTRYVVISGRDWTPHGHVPGGQLDRWLNPCNNEVPPSNPRFPGVAPLGDWDGDGASDFAFYDDSEPWSWSLTFVSGALTEERALPLGRVGAEPYAVADIASLPSDNPSQHRLLVVGRGRDGAGGPIPVFETEIRESPGDLEIARFEGDLGVVWAGTHDARVSRVVRAVTRDGLVEVRSLATGQVVDHFTAAHHDEGSPLLRTVNRVHDLTGDGVPELATTWEDVITGELCHVWHGSVVIHDGATYAEIARVSDLSNNCFPSVSSVAFAGDWNGDGVDEVAIAAHTYVGDVEEPLSMGRVYIYSIADCAL